MPRDEQAIRPSVPFTDAAEEQAELEAQERDKEFEATDQAIADLKYHKGFQELRKQLDDTITALRTGKYLSIDRSDSPELIGHKFIASQTSADILEGVLQQVAVEIENDQEE